jgi:hypothetical protein
VDKYGFTTRDLTFSKTTSPQVAITLIWISQSLEPNQGSTPQDQGPKDASTSSSVHTRILAEDIVSDQYWYLYLLKYLDQAVTFYNAGHPVICCLVSTLYEINMDLLQLPQLVLQASVKSKQSFY